MLGHPGLSNGVWPAGSAKVAEGWQALNPQTQGTQCLQHTDPCSPVAAVWNAQGAAGTPPTFHSSLPVRLRTAQVHHVFLAQWTQVRGWLYHTDVWTEVRPELCELAVAH